MPAAHVFGGLALTTSGCIYATLLKQLAVLRAYSLHAPSMVAGGEQHAPDAYL